MSHRCEGCGNRTEAHYLCRSCKSALHHASKRIDAEGLLVDQAGGSWWVWSAKGEVLVIGKSTKLAAILALHKGEDEEDTL